jgi:hypothetical protein
MPVSGSKEQRQTKVTPVLHYLPEAHNLILP